MTASRRQIADVAFVSARPLREVLGLAPDGSRAPLQHSASFAPIAPGCVPGPALLAGASELARWIRGIIGAPTRMQLRYRAEEGGWTTVKGSRYVGRNVPTIRAAIEGCVMAEGRIYLLDRSDVTDRTSLADIAAAQRAIRALILAALAPKRPAGRVAAPARKRLAAAEVL